MKASAAEQLLDVIAVWLSISLGVVTHTPCWCAEAAVQARRSSCRTSQHSTAWWPVHGLVRLYTLAPMLSSGCCAEAAVQARAAEQLSDAMAGMVTKGNVEAEQEAARKKEEKRIAQEAEDARKVGV